MEEISQSDSNFENRSSTNESTKYLKRNKELFPWKSPEMVQYQKREMVLQTTLIEIFYYTIFLALLTTSIVGVLYYETYFLTSILSNLFLNRKFIIASNVKITFNEIKTASDVWAYSTTLFVDALYWEYWYDNSKPIADLPEEDRNVLYENKLLGLPRIRQLKVHNRSCTIHDNFVHLFKTCYGRFTRHSEDTSPFGKATGTAWTHNSAEKTGQIGHSGKVSSYYGGGYYQNLDLTRNATIEKIEDLKKNLWITRGTRCIFLDFTLYNANLNLFFVAKLVFEFPPTGGVLPSHSFQTLKLIRYVSISDYIIMGCEILVVCFILFYTVKITKDICFFRWEYLKHFWNYIDILILMLAYGCIILAVIRKISFEDSMDTYLSQNNSEYGNFDFPAAFQSTYNSMVAVLLFVAYTKIFKYLSINKTMGQLNSTLSKCALDVAGFSVMFFIIFFAYAELGYLLFGTQVTGFSGFGVSMFTLLRTILGDFNYLEIESANRILAPIYFLSYIFLVFFVLLNMFLAIINDTYSDVKTEIAIAPKEMQVWDYFKRGFFGFLRKCGCKSCVPHKKRTPKQYSATVDEICINLRRCGFTEREIQSFFAHYNIDSEKDVDINKLVAELEAKSTGISTSTKQTNGPESFTSIAVDDFLAQQERLAEVESSLGQLTNKVDALLKKLDTLNFRKAKK